MYYSTSSFLDPKCDKGILIIMNSVGAILRTERERQSRATAEIAEELCITQRYLRAIEQDDLKSLPGTFFYKSFVRQYAAIVGIDPTSLQPGVDALTMVTEPLPVPGGDPRYTTHTAEARPHEKPIRDLDPIVREDNRRYFQSSHIGLSIAGLVAVLLACSGFYSWYNRAPEPVSAAKQQQAPPPVPVPEHVITPVKVETPPPQAAAA